MCLLLPGVGKRYYTCYGHIQGVILCGRLREKEIAASKIEKKNKKTLPSPSPSHTTVPF